MEVVHPTDGTAHVLCKHCRLVILHPNRNADKCTSNMKRHLDNCASYRSSVRRQAGQLPSRGPDMLFDLMGWNNPQHSEVMTRDRLKEKVLRIIISGNLAFSFAQN